MLGEQEMNREMPGAAYQDNDLICCRPDGSLWLPSAFTSAHRALLKCRGLDGPNFHALRHSHAGHLLLTASISRPYRPAADTAKLPGQDQEVATFFVSRRPLSYALALK
jgi:hypothetical protein